NFVNNIPSIYPVFERDEDGYKVIDDVIGGYKYDYGFGTDRARGFSANINPAGAVQLDVNESLSHQISANSMLEATIAKNLKFSTTFGVQALASTSSGLTNMFYGDAAGLGRISKSNMVNFSYTWNQILSYNFAIGKHNFETFVAHENTFTQNKSQSGSMSNIASPYSVELSNGIIKDGMGSSTSEYALESYFGQAKYDYQNKYFAHLTIRQDGTSRFPNDKWGTFGSIGAAWMLSNESFLKSSSWIKQLKYKISYGILGNQSLGIYPTFDSYGINNLNDQLSINFGGKGNPNLTWEQSKNFNTGFETKITDRINFDIEYFRKITDNLLYYKQVAPSLGYASYPVNDGKLLNSGVEFQLFATVIQKSDFRFDVTLNGAKYNNKILTMPKDDTTGEPKNIELKGAYAYAKDRSIYDFYMREWAGVDPTNGEANWYRYYDELANGEKIYITDMANYTNENTITNLGKEATNDYNLATKKFLDKSVVPTIAGGLNLNFEYKNWAFNTQFAYSFGGYSYDNAYATLMSDHAPGAINWHTDILQRWQEEGDVTDVPRLTANYDKYDSAASSRFSA
ncbi:MAG: TonB-dependent receptor, partial [Rhodobacteraceae bacterium]|nr:TonB-dependent receptor [Paracoccaceae bacterium]